MAVIVLAFIAIAAVSVAVGFWRRQQQIDKEKAPDAAKPFYDFLATWPKYSDPGMPRTDSGYASKQLALTQGWAKSKGLPLGLYLPGKSPITPAEAPAEAADLIDRGLGLITVLNTAGIMAEAASFGQIESVIWSVMNIINATGIPRLTSGLYAVPTEIGLKIPLQRYMNNLYQPHLPDLQALTELRSKGMLTETAYNAWMKEHGYPEWASDVMAYAKTKQPGFSDLLSLLRRGEISGPTFKTWLRRSGLHPDVTAPLETLRWEIPAYGDIISIYMREGYLAEKWVEIPEGYLGFMKQLGYSEMWATQIWGKHWVLPSVGHLYEMFHKKIIDYGTMAQMLRYHDFEPVWRARLIENAYAMIPRVDLRRAYMYGVPGFEDLVERYEKLGYSPDDAGTMDAIAKRFALTRYYTRLETVARAAYRKGQISEADFKKVLVKINTPAPAIALILEAENLARDAAVLEPAEEPRILTTSQILRLFTLGLVDKDRTLERLRSLGFSSEDAALLINMATPKPDPVRPTREIVSAASLLYREGWMSPGEFEGWLYKAGLSHEEIMVTKEAQDLRYRLDYARELLAVSREHFRKDLITAGDYYLDLLAFGCRPERAAALVALEEARRLPKPRAPAAA